MSEFAAYNGDEFFQLKFPERKFLIDKLMREKDSVLFLGGEKSGKSVFVQQLICSLTTGTHPFLDEYDILRPCRVTYIQLEGELGDTQDRFKRMIAALDFNRNNFQIIFSGPLMLQEKEHLHKLIKDIETMHNPDVIIIDPLYFACVGGSISSDEHIIKFTSNMRILKDHFGCSLLVVHHTHKVKIDKDGNLIQEGDDALFGSVFLKAWPDHILLFTYNKKTGYRHLSCGTQRSGDIVRNLTLELVQPYPLYFRKNEQGLGDNFKSLAIHQLLSKKEHEDGLSADQIIGIMNISRSTFYKAIKASLVEKQIIKNDSSRPVKYLVSSVSCPSTPL